VASDDNNELIIYPSESDVGIHTITVNLSDGFDTVTYYLIIEVLPDPISEST
jgi:hypothetical protein